MKQLLSAFWHYDEFLVWCDLLIWQAEHSGVTSMSQVSICWLMNQIHSFCFISYLCCCGKTFTSNALKFVSGENMLVTLIKFYRQKGNFTSLIKQCCIVSVKVFYKLCSASTVMQKPLLTMLLPGVLFRILRGLFYLLQSLSLWLPPCLLTQSFVKETRSLDSFHFESGLLLYRRSV